LLGFLLLASILVHCLEIFANLLEQVEHEYEIVDTQIQNQNAYQHVAEVDPRRGIKNAFIHNNGSQGDHEQDEDGGLVKNLDVVVLKLLKGMTARHIYNKPCTHQNLQDNVEEEHSWLLWDHEKHHLVYAQCIDNPTDKEGYIKAKLIRSLRVCFDVRIKSPIHCFKNFIL
jgi:hypothetical protein